MTRIARNRCYYFLWFTEVLPLDAGLKGSWFLSQAKKSIIVMDTSSQISKMCYPGNPWNMFCEILPGKEEGETGVLSGIWGCVVSAGQKGARPERFSPSRLTTLRACGNLLDREEEAGPPSSTGSAPWLQTLNNFLVENAFSSLACVFLMPTLLIPIRKCYLIPSTAWWPLCGFPT